MLAAAILGPFCVEIAAYGIIKFCFISCSYHLCVKNAEYDTGLLSNVPRGTSRLHPSNIKGPIFSSKFCVEYPIP